MSDIKWEELYKRYNQFGEYFDAYTVMNQYTMIQVYLDSYKDSFDMETRIIKGEQLSHSIDGFQALKYESMLPQPKSIVMHIYFLGIVANSIPDEFYKKYKCDAQSIVGITVAIALYYFGLQTVKYSGLKISETQKKNMIESEDFKFSISDIKKVRAVTSTEDFVSYMNLFCDDISNIRDKEHLGLFCDKGKYCILCIDEFINYIIYRLERIYLSQAEEKDKSFYAKAKGDEFENFVFYMIGLFSKDKYHTLYYYPRRDQKREIDILIRDKNNLCVLECKSGTVDLSTEVTDDQIISKIKQKVYKAYETLDAVTEYVSNVDKYSFKYENELIEGQCDDLFCIHVTMYAMDFMSSNIHALLPQYLKVDNPILSISIEHLLAIMLDKYLHNGNINDYWRARKEFIEDNPSMFLDQNELDLYYEITNNNTMLHEMKDKGILNQLKPTAKIISTFHNQFGQEFRPAQEMIKTLDSFLLPGLLENAKKNFGINNRYSKNLFDYLRINCD